MGRRVWVNRRGNRKTSFQILESQDLESQDRVLTISVRLKYRARELAASLNITKQAVAQWVEVPPLRVLEAVPVFMEVQSGFFGN